MSSRYRYEELASFIAGLVSNGTLEPGARVPSLRQISRQHQISISTALQAYRLLEDRSVIEARPQSGYYVARSGGKARQNSTSATSSPAAAARSAPRPADVSRLLECAADPALVPLGCAIPSASLVAMARLDRFLARAARLTGERHNRYTVPKGELRLRRAIARRALRWGQALSAEDIVITSGCTEALTLALQAVARRGDAIAVEAPTHFGVLNALAALDMRPYCLPADRRQGVDLPALARALEQRAVRACLLSSSFNNPLGFTLTTERKVALLELLAAHQVPLIEDDIYGDVHFDHERPTPFAALDHGDNMLYCSSFSKTVAPGYRIGWIATRRYNQRVLERKLAFTLTCPALPQAALAEFLATGGYDSHLRRLRRTFEHTVAQVARTVETAFPHGTRVTHPRGGYLLWVELPRALRSRELFERALAAGICFVPGDIFSPRGEFGHCLRLSCGHEWDARTEQALVTLGEMARALLAGESGRAPGAQPPHPPQRRCADQEIEEWVV
jgi:DNA-binding transcriptional MocR family regulator